MTRGYVFVGILAITATLGLATSFVRLPADPAMLRIVAPAAVMLFAIAAYAHCRGAPLLAEIAWFSGLLIASSVIGARLSYLAAGFGMPLQDATVAAVDRALGFDWLLWTQTVNGHPWLHRVLDLAYMSHLWQPGVSVVILALWGPRGRNAELWTGLQAGLLLTIALSALVPVLGPADAHGMPTPSGRVLLELRAGASDRLPYIGIVSFPSFHTEMAILFAWAQRGIPWSFAVFAVVNGAMLMSIPYAGDHYLCDMLAGAVVAWAAIWIAGGSRLPRRTSVAAVPGEKREL